MQLNLSLWTRRRLTSRPAHRSGWPDAVAIVVGSDTLAYRDLDTRANRITLLALYVAARSLAAVSEVRRIGVPRAAPVVILCSLLYPSRCAV